jgi:hypothetical protein
MDQATAASSETERQSHHIAAGSRVSQHDAGRCALASGTTVAGASDRRWCCPADR